MVDMLSMVRSEQDRIIAAARSMGAIIPESTIRQAGEYADQLQLIEQGTQSLAVQSQMVLAPLTLKWSELDCLCRGRHGRRYRKLPRQADNP
jgi:hypothetical protein